eukprot:gene42595-52045_t
MYKLLAQRRSQLVFDLRLGRWSFAKAQSRNLSTPISQTKQARVVDWSKLLTSTSSLTIQQPDKSWLDKYTVENGDADAKMTKKQKELASILQATQTPFQHESADNNDLENLSNIKTYIGSLLESKDVKAVEDLRTALGAKLLPISSLTADHFHAFLTHPSYLALSAKHRVKASLGWFSVMRDVAKITPTAETYQFLLPLCYHASAWSEFYYLLGESRRSGHVLTPGLLHALLSPPPSAAHTAPPSSSFHLWLVQALKDGGAVLPYPSATVSLLCNYLNAQHKFHLVKEAWGIIRGGGGLEESVVSDASLAKELL